MGQELKTGQEYLYVDAIYEFQTYHLKLRIADPSYVAYHLGYTAIHQLYNNRTWKTKTRESYNYYRSDIKDMGKVHLTTEVALPLDYLALSERCKNEYKAKA